MSHLGGSLPFCGPGSFHDLPLSHSPPDNRLYLLKRKTLPILFSASKTFKEVVPLRMDNQTSGSV